MVPEEVKPKPKKHRFPWLTGIRGRIAAAMATRPRQPEELVAFLPANAQLVNTQLSANVQPQTAPSNSGLPTSIQASPVIVPDNPPSSEPAIPSVLNVTAVETIVTGPPVMSGVPLSDDDDGAPAPTQTKVISVQNPPGSAPQWLRDAASWTWRLALVAGGVVLLAYVVTRLRMVFLALFFALVITSVLRPLRNVFDRHMRRGFSVLLSLLTAVAVVALIIAYIVASVMGNWASVGAQFGSGLQQFLDVLRGPPLHLAIPYETVAQAVTAVQTWISDHYADIAGNLMAGVGTVTYAIATIALSIFLSAFFLSSGRQMWHWGLSQFPARTQHKISLAFGAAFITFSGYARGQILISLIDSILAAILLSVLRIPLAIPLAVLVFIGSLIPMIGAPAAMLIAGVVALAADGPLKALIVIGGVALIGQIENHLLQPFLMGHQVRLHPVAIALAVAAGTILGGIFGAVIAVPLVAVAWRMFQVLRAAPSTELATTGAGLST
ncbi:MAG: AI-2E family transporter [Promicromonosporaceae bacterium]|nr:AI-2E family transporter [Promicromonosporaceae bacterium]